MSDLRQSLLKLAHEHPEMREHILPLLKNAAEDPWVEAAKIIDGGPRMQVQMLQKHLDKFAKGFQQAKRELDGHRKFGVGETESVNVMMSNLYSPLKSLHELTGHMVDRLEALAKSAKF